MNSYKSIILLKEGGIGVIPTDTIYGIVGSALNPQAVEKIYNLRKRSKDKPMIILISEIADIQIFGIDLTSQQNDFLQKIWPNSVSVVLPIISDKYKYLHRGKNSLAFRIPSNKDLLNMLKEVGPLVAPSANYEGDKPSESVNQAKKYFNEEVDFYLDGGEIKSQPSTIIQLDKDGTFEILRAGSFRLLS